jgi:hypothetical protein
METVNEPGKEYLVKSTEATPSSSIETISVPEDELGNSQVYQNIQSENYTIKRAYSRVIAIVKEQD